VTEDAQPPSPEESLTRRRFLRAGAAVGGGLIWGAGLGAVHARAARLWPLANTATERARADLAGAADPTGATGPVAARLRAFTASRTRFGTVLRWRTASEVRIVGFNVYRSSAGRVTRLNRRLIPAAGAAGARSYAWRDRVVRGTSSRPAAYWLEIVSADGSRVRYGPAVTLG
jgi:hypothetical protein